MVFSSLAPQSGLCLQRTDAESWFAPLMPRQPKWPGKNHFPSPKMVFSSLAPQSGYLPLTAARLPLEATVVCLLQKSLPGHANRIIQSWGLCLQRTDAESWFAPLMPRQPKWPGKWFFWSSEGRRHHPASDPGSWSTPAACACKSGSVTFESPNDPFFASSAPASARSNSKEDW